jgi:hypothetical protein
MPNEEVITLRPITFGDYVRHRPSGERLQVLGFNNGFALCQEIIPIEIGKAWRAPRNVTLPLAELELEIRIF